VGPTLIRPFRSAAGIKVITGVSGKIKDAIEAFKAGRFESSNQPNVGNHYGMGGGMGSGMGMGRGMGRGMRGGIMSQVSPSSRNPEQEIEMLKSETQILGQQLTEIRRRLEELEKGR